MPSFRPFTASGIYTGITEPKVPSSLNNTDVYAPEISLYIEGIQVPFIAISVNQAYGRKPIADIQIPPESGLMDIIRGYEPKVHIFYKDAHYGGYRLLFWGRITSSNYSRSREGSGNSSISFHCEHKNSLLDQVTLDFSGWASNATPSNVDPNTNQAVGVLRSLNSQSMVITAMEGVDGLAGGDTLISRTNPNVSSAPTNKLDPSLEKHAKRLIGLPAISVNIWNQIKQNCYRNPVLNLALETMYIPLVEDGLSFFKRMSGHLMLESKVQEARAPYCHKIDGKEVSILIPPSMTLPIASADQQRMAVEIINNQVGFSGELTSFENILRSFYTGMQYEIITLSSPAEINSDPEVFIESFDKPGGEQSTIETIIKPQLPVYYSPICNVLLPRMYSSISINQEEGDIPSRVSATYDAFTPVGGNSSITLTYRGPASIREAVAYNSFLQSNSIVQNLSLNSTKNYSYSIPGIYEQGRGIKTEATAFPWWLGVFSSNKTGQTSVPGTEQVPEKGTIEYDAMMAMTLEWRNRNGIFLREEDAEVSAINAFKKYGLNPYDPTNKDILPHERLFYSTVDYEYSKRILGSRSGVIEAAFNPYIIPGYPMDVIDDSPNHPSFHGLCTSVTHTITSRSIHTSIGMAAATTYAELSNYYSPPAPPFLQTALDLINADIDDTIYEKTSVGDASPFSNVSSTLLQNPKAKASADIFYQQVLGVGAAAPGDLIHFPSGRAYPVDRIAGVFKSRVVPQEGATPDDRGHDLVDVNGRSLVDYYSTVGSLRLVSRPVESQASISSKFGYNFVNLDKNLYNSTYVNYRNPLLAANFYLEPGASMFLDYMETEDFIKAAKR